MFLLGFFTREQTLGNLLTAQGQGFSNSSATDLWALEALSWTQQGAEQHP